MKHLHKSIFSFALASSLCLASCSQDDMLNGSTDTVKGHPVQLTLTVNRGETQTRTVLSENDKNGGLNDKWVDGDMLKVYNSAGKKIGDLNLIEGADSDTGIFSGTVTAENGTGSYRVWYYNDAVVTFGNNANESYDQPTVEVDLSNQAYEDVPALSAMDMLSQDISLTITDKAAVVAESCTMVARLAMVRFSLKNIDGASGTLKIYDESNANRAIITKGSFGLAPNHQGQQFRNASSPAITVSVTEGKDVYLALYPDSYKIGFEFTAAETNKKYKFAFNNSTTLEAGKYYCAFDKDEGLGEDEPGEIGGIPVNFEPVIDYDIEFKADPEGTTVYDYDEDLSDPSSVELPDNPNPENPGEFKGWKIEGSQDEPTEGPWDLTAEGKGPKVTLVPVYEYTWTITFKSSVKEEVLNTMTVTSRSDNAEAQLKFPSLNTIDLGSTLSETERKNRFLGWYLSDLEGKTWTTIKDADNTWFYFYKTSVCPSVTFDSATLDLTTDDMNPVIWAVFKGYWVVYHHEANEGNGLSMYNPDHMKVDYTDSYLYKLYDENNNLISGAGRWVDYYNNYDKFVSQSDLQPLNQDKFDYWLEYIPATKQTTTRQPLVSSNYKNKWDEAKTKTQTFWIYDFGKNVIHFKDVYSEKPKTVATPGYNQGKFN